MTTQSSSDVPPGQPGATANVHPSSDPLADPGLLAAVPIADAIEQSGLDFGTLVLLVMLDIGTGPAIRSYASDFGMLINVDDAIAAASAIRGLKEGGGR